jgi:hypothetical protein
MKNHLYFQPTLKFFFLEEPDFDLNNFRSSVNKVCGMKRGSSLTTTGKRKRESRDNQIPLKILAFIQVTILQSFSFILIFFPSP